MADRQRSRESWLRAARLALLRHGVNGVSIEPLAMSLGVTKGSFYWHFKDRTDLLEALLREWEQEAALLTDALRGGSDTALPGVIGELRRRTLASERGEWPSDVAIFAWAAVDPAVARRVNRAEEDRMRLFRELTGEDALADLFYYAYHGFLHRRRRVPRASSDFDQLARLALGMLARRPAKPSRERRRSRRALEAR
jgi:AcrR family transcriptional regulator